MMFTHVPCYRVFTTNDTILMIRYCYINVQTYILTSLLQPSLFSISILFSVFNIWYKLYRSISCKSKFTDYDFIEESYILFTE